jgi:hypothetical protein
MVPIWRVPLHETAALGGLTKLQLGGSNKYLTSLLVFLVSNVRLVRFVSSVTIRMRSTVYRDHPTTKFLDPLGDLLQALDATVLSLTLHYKERADGGVLDLREIALRGPLGPVLKHKHIRLAL